MKAVEWELSGLWQIFSGRQKIFWRPLKSVAAGGKKYFSGR
jgi:hypothetical protein